MSATTAEPLRKHRHDLGHEDHGPKLAVGTTRAIQIVLAMWLALTVGVVIAAIVDASTASHTAVPST